jgi:hypothetical protein
MQFINGRMLQPVHPADMRHKVRTKTHLWPTMSPNFLFSGLCKSSIPHHQPSQKP